MLSQSFREICPSMAREDGANKHTDISLCSLLADISSNALDKKNMATGRGATKCDPAHVQGFGSSFFSLFCVYFSLHTQKRCGQVGPSPCCSQSHVCGKFRSLDQRV